MKYVEVSLHQHVIFLLYKDTVCFIEQSPIDSTPYKI